MSGYARRLPLSTLSMDPCWKLGFLESSATNVVFGPMQWESVRKVAGKAYDLLGLHGKVSLPQSVDGSCGWPRFPPQAPVRGCPSAPDPVDRRRSRGLQEVGAGTARGRRLRLVGESEDGESALEAVATLRPAVVLLDIQLPGIDGFDVAARLAGIAHPPAVVLISSREAAAYGSRLRDAPSRGFIPKRELTGEAVVELIA